MVEFIAKQLGFCYDCKFSIISDDDIPPNF